MEVPGMPPNIKLWNNKKKLEWLQQLVDPLVDKLMYMFEAPDMTGVPLRPEYAGLAYDIVAPAQLRGQQLNMVIAGEFNSYF